MNPALCQLRAEFPHGVLPEVFGVITAADPQELRGENGLPGSILGDALRIKGWQHFPAAVVLPGSDEPRVSFAVVENLAKLERLARDFIRPGIFWVQRGEMIQMFFGQKPPKPLGPWDRFSARPPAHLHVSGNLGLLDKPAIAFLCSTQCPGDKILEAYDWARRQCDEGSTVISGFHTPVERDVLEILARRGANLIWVPGRDLPKTLDFAFKVPMDENRLLILSPFPYCKPSRPTKETCSLRNHFVLGWTPRRFISHVAPGSSLAADLEDHLL
jgi:hypothetical protein